MNQRLLLRNAALLKRSKREQSFDVKYCSIRLDVEPKCVRLPTRQHNGFDMTLSYTSDQLIREARLLLNEVALLTDLAIGERAGIRALGLEEQSDYAQTRHPDELGEIYGYEVWDHIVGVERYVQQQAWNEALPNQLHALAMIVERTFSPCVLTEYEAARLNHPEPSGVPSAYEVGAGDVDLAHFHMNILARLIALGEARLKLDSGERLTMSDIALLLGVKEATVVTNAHRKNFASVEEGNRRYAEPTDVLPWMVKQGYNTTTKGGHSSEPKGKSDADREVLFVPVAKDGSWFEPGSRSAGRYSIGAASSERKFTDYFQALAALVALPTPRWRTNKNGVPGIAFGVRFERVSRTELERLVAESDPGN